MNTSKQINIMVALVFLAIIATGLYTIWDPNRAADAKNVQLSRTVQRGAYLFSQNCIVCHGNAGEGGAASQRLRQAPPLNRPDLQGKNPDGTVDKANKTAAYKLIVDTITCGRIGKAMPPWAISQGGTMNDEQIRQLATFINEGTGWDQSAEFAVRGMPSEKILGYNSDGLRLAQSLDATSTTVFLNNVTPLGKGLRLQIGDELMSITADPNPENKSVTVERGLGTTNPAPHDEGAEVLKPPVPPDPPGITGESSAVCGQRAQPTAPAVAETPAASLSITAQGIAWNKTALAAVAGQPLIITVDNKDAGTPHNWALHRGTDATGERIIATEIQNGPVTETLNFGPLEPGQYYFLCEVHPQMEGILTVSAAGAATLTTPAVSGPAGTPQPGGFAGGGGTPSAPIATAPSGTPQAGATP